MVFKTLREDINAYLERDPAARGRLEVVLCYPGFHALIAYRLCHWLWSNNLFLLGRFLLGVILQDKKYDKVIFINKLHCEDF